MKKAPLQFSIPKPCRESFADMPKSGEGRLCGKCETIIYDFSQMTDAELIRFFEAKPETHCGRFHNSQLNRVIEPVAVRNNFFSRFAGIAASVIAILTLRSAPAKAQGEMRPMLAQSPQAKRDTLAAANNIIRISGTVKDDEGKPLKGAIVKFDDLKETTTDESGAYSFELSDINEPHNIYFSCRNYVRTVRTFNPGMGSTSFDVVLGSRDEDAEVWSTGIMIRPSIGQQLLGDLPSLMFKKHAVIKLDKETKALLRVIGAKMKSYPTSGIVVTSYPPGCGKQYLWGQKNEEIKKYLVEHEGINADRISTNAEVGGGDENTIDIIPAP